MAIVEPDRERDVVVQHVKGGPSEVEQWVVFLGQEKRAALETQQNAMVFARLLADLQQRRIWLCHDTAGELRPFDSRALRGCSCC